MGGTLRFGPIAVAVVGAVALIVRFGAPVEPRAFGVPDGGPAIRDGAVVADGGAADGPAAVAPGTAVLVGDVFDARGWPIAGASVRVVFLDGKGGVAAPGAPLLEPAGELGILKGQIPFPPREPAAASPAATAVSDGRGVFRVAALPAGRVLVMASHPSFADGHSDEVALTATGEWHVQIVLRPGVAVRGRVSDERGPIAGVELWVRGALATVSDGSGRFVLPRLADPTEIEARARGYLALRRTVDPAAVDGGDHDLDLKLAHAGGRVTGVVVDERSFPVAGARVVATAGGYRGEAVSDRKGEFTVDGTPEAALAVRVTHDDHPPATRERVSPGDDVRIALLPGAGVDGEVRDERTSAPLGNARVTVESGGEKRVAAVDQRGRFRLVGCAPGLATVSAVAPGYLPLSRAVVLPVAELSREVTLCDLRLELTLGGSIAGTVLDDRGAVAPTVVVTAADARGVSDASGRFTLGPLAPGRVEVRAGNATETVTVDAGRTARVELRLR